MSLGRAKRWERPATRVCLVCNRTSPPSPQLWLQVLLLLGAAAFRSRVGLQGKGPAGRLSLTGKKS